MDTTQLALPHLTEDILENYSLGRLSEPQIARVETHLLVCHGCQDALADADDYVAAMQAALAEPISEPAPSRWATFVDQLRRLRPVPVFASAFAGICLALVLYNSPAAQTAEITLRSVRGGSADLTAVGPAGAPLNLTIQSEHLRLDQSFRARIVDAAGKPTWAGAPEFTQEAGYVLHVDTPLHAGAYWIRLYDSDRKLLQEYGLRLK